MASKTKEDWDMRVPGFFAELSIISFRSQYRLRLKRGSRSFARAVAQAYCLDENGENVPCEDLEDPGSGTSGDGTSGDGTSGDGTSVDGTSDGTGDVNLGYSPDAGPTYGPPVICGQCCCPLPNGETQCVSGSCQSWQTCVCSCSAQGASQTCQ
jgi:hypothetical protein